jgi:nucleoid-associated protein YejK
MYAIIFYHVCMAYTPDDEWPAVNKDPLVYGFNSEQGDSLCSIMLVTLLEGSDDLDTQLSQVESKGLQWDLAEQLTNDLRSASFASFKYIADICFIGLLPKQAAVDILTSLTKDCSNFMDFNKILMLFCGLQKLTFSHTELNHLYLEFIKNGPIIAHQFHGKQKLTSENALQDLILLGG